MIVIHAYTVLGVIHVAAYVPAGTPAVGQPLQEDRLLARSERLPWPQGTAAALLDCVEEVLETMHREGRDVAAVLDA